MRVDKLRPNPNLARAYLQLAFVSVTNTLREAAAIPDPNARDELNGLALFATAYLFPEVQRYLPGAQGAWSGLHRQALTGTSEPRKATVEARLEYLLEIRSSAKKYESTEDGAPPAAAPASAGEPEPNSKQADPCKRDRSRAELALYRSRSKKFVEARQAADQIEDSSLRENVLQFMNGDIALAALDSGNLVEAASLAEKVTAKSERALLFVKIAARSLKKGDKSGALDLLNRARVLVRDEEPELQSDALTAVANVYEQFDPLEAVMVLRDAIKALNRVKSQYTEPFSVLRQVSLSCVGAPSYFAARETADTTDVFGTLALIASSEVKGQEALLIASELENKATRLRAQLAIVKAVTKDK